MEATGVRTYRDWEVLVYCAVGCLVLGFVAAFAFPPALLMAIPFAVWLFVVLRQHAVISGTDLLLHGVFRQQEIDLSLIDGLSVVFSRWRFGWRIRLHCGEQYAETFPFLSLVGFRTFSAAFPQPPSDAPVLLKDLYATLAARIVPSGPA